MNKDNLQAQLNTAHTALRDAMTSASAVETEVTLRRRELSAAEAQAVAGGAITGKNEAERKASAALVLQGEHAAVAEAEDARVVAQLELRHAQLDWDLARQLVKLAVG